jgi:FKBP-type peptidyl-prolyl cis-trans isomerase FklB
MKSFVSLVLLLGLSIAAIAQDRPLAERAVLSNDRARASYAFGMNMALGWKRGQVDLSPDLVGQGLKDALTGGSMLFPAAETKDALAKYGRAMKALQQAGGGEPAKENPPQGDSRQNVGDESLKNLRSRASYAYGVNLGRGWKEGQVDLDPELAVRGLKDALGSGPKLLSEAEMTETLARFGRELRLVQQHHRDEMAEENLRLGESFLARNKTLPGVISLPSGLQYKVIVQGTGPNPTLTNWVKLEYRGTKIDGTEFESSAAHPEASIYGMGGVTQGWAEALQLMQPGAEWRLFIPSALAYGKDGSPGIGPNEALIYDIKLISILPGQPQPTAQDIKDERSPDGD